MITYQIVAGVLGTILLGIVGWICAAFYQRLVSIQKDLTELQLQITKLQSSLVSREEMRQMVADEVRRQMIQNGD